MNYVISGLNLELVFMRETVCVLLMHLGTLVKVKLKDKMFRVIVRFN